MLDFYAWWLTPAVLVNYQRHFKNEKKSQLESSIRDRTPVHLYLYFRGSRDGAVVRALASHQCVPGSIPGPGVICGLSLLLVFFLAPGSPVFPSPQKPTFLNSNSIWNCQALYHEPLARVIAQALPVFDIKFDLHLHLHLHLYLHLYLHLVPRSEQSTVSVAKHIFSPNGGYCVYYPSNIFRNVRSFGNWGIFNNNSPKWRWLANIQRLPPTLRWIAVLVYTKTVRWYTPQQINLDVIFSKLLGDKKRRIFGVLRANQRASSTLSIVLVYTK